MEVENESNECQSMARRPTPDHRILMGLCHLKKDEEEGEGEEEVELLEKIKRAKALVVRGC